MKMIFDVWVVFCHMCSKKTGILILAAGIIFSSFLFSCSLLFDSDSDEENELSVEGFSMETDQGVYFAEEGSRSLEITYAYMNESRQALYSGTCRDTQLSSLEKLVDGEWILAYSPVCQSLYLGSGKIGKGEHLDAVFELHPSVWDPARHTNWKGGDIEGEYRLMKSVYGKNWDSDKYDRHLLPSEIVVSNTFEIRRAE